MEDLTTLRFSTTTTNSDNLKNKAKSAVCDNNSATLSLNKTSLSPDTCLQHSPNSVQRSKRNLQTDFFITLLLVYHMVQWIKVTRTNGQSHQEDDEY